MYRVLLIQPERLFMTVCAAALRDAGYEVCTADNGPEALSSLRATRPDLVICSFQLRLKERELALIEAMREEDEVVPIVVFARDPGDEELLDAMARGASLYVRNQFNQGQIVELVKHVSRQGNGIAGPYDSERLLQHDFQRASIMEKTRSFA